MKKKSYEKATARLCIRLRPSEKKKLSEAVTKNGFPSVTSFIIHAIQKKPVTNFSIRKEFITTLHVLSFEINRIGNNINQAVHLMHQDKLTSSLQPSSIQRFNQLLADYNQLAKTLARLFEKIIRHE